MSTITRELAKLFRKITNSEIDAEGNAHVVLSPADSLLINNARIALAAHLQTYGDYGRSKMKETYTVKVEGVKVWVEVVNRKASYVATAMTGMRRLRSLPGQVG